MTKKPCIKIYSDVNQFEEIIVLIDGKYLENKREDIFSQAIKRAVEEYLFLNRNTPVDNMPNFSVEVKNIWE